jgi:hypothetical protein
MQKTKGVPSLSGKSKRVPVLVRHGAAEEGKVVNNSAASCVRGLDVDGISKCNSDALRPRVREGEKLLCTWREACKAADYVLEHFGDKSRDRGIWIWYCRRIGLDVFLDIADEVISSARQGELRWPTRALQRHLQEALPKPASALRATARQGGGVA